MNHNKELNDWLDTNFGYYQDAIFDQSIYDDLIKVKDIWLNTHAGGKKVIFAGNGGSAAIASHCAVDLTKAAGVRAVNFNEADLITCFGNDYGYENWVKQALDFYGDEGDTAVLISSSGSSPNIVNAAEHATQMGLDVITFSGFKPDNPLRQSGSINFWVDSQLYNVVEMTHHIWLVVVIDMIALRK